MSLATWWAGIQGGAASAATPSFSAGTFNVVDLALPPNDARAVIQLRTNGQVWAERQDGPDFQLGTWITGTFNPADWEARFTPNVGSLSWGPSDSITPFWNNLGSQRNWGEEETGIGVEFCSGTIDIRPAGGGAIVTTCTANLSAEATP